MLDKLLKVFKTLFYVVGIITFLVILNKPNPSKTTSTHIEQPKKTETVVNKTVIEHNYITPNTIGLLLVGAFTLMIVTGIGYAFTSRPKSTKPFVKANLI